MASEARTNPAVLLAVLFVAVAFAGCFQGAPEPEARYEATIRWTSHGVPHIVADDWLGLGYGYGFAFARDNACVLAEEVVTVNGERSLHFGPDGTTTVNALGLEWTNLESDLFHRLYNGRDDLAISAGIHAVPEARDLIDGFVHGFNRWLAQTPTNDLPEPCRGADWLRPITIEDLERRFLKLQLFASGLALAPYALAASPPGVTAPADKAPALPADGFPFPHASFGSNGYAFGGSATADGRGLLLGNPHFPWVGPERFHQLHLTIPGTVDVMGATLYGVPMVLIGFNEHVAWTHTVSTAWRFTLYELDLVEGDPTRYRYDGSVEAMEPVEVTVPVRTASGAYDNQTHTFWLSRFGPVVEIGVQELVGQSVGLDWTPRNAYTFRDANAFNTRIAEQFLRFAHARSVDEVRVALTDVLGIPWVNTIAADRSGNALYADVSVVPHVPTAQLEACNTAVGRALLEAARLPVLDGSTSDCAWTVHPAAPQEGIVPPDALPWTVTDEWVINSNDSHWLPNPGTPLEGYSILIGDERTERSGRTRMGYVQIGERLAGAADCTIDPDAPCDAMTAARLQDDLFADRVFFGEAVRDAVVAQTCAGGLAVASDGSLVDLGPACDVLASWDLRAQVDSRGLVLFERFWLRAPQVWTTPFDADDPVATPRGYVAGHPDVRRALADAMLELEAADIALDASVGEARNVVRGEDTLPVHGAHHAVGSPSMAIVPFEPGEGFTEEIHGNSYIQVVTWDEEGPNARGLLTYSQSTDPASPHAADQTRLFSGSQWTALAYSEPEILADPALDVIELAE